jgi:hypothetical protein
MTSPNQPPSPKRFFATPTVFQQSAALKGALGLDVFTAIAEGNVTVAALAGRRRDGDARFEHGFYHSNSGNGLVRRSDRIEIRSSPRRPRCSWINIK